MFKTISFYQFTSLADPALLRDSLRQICEERSILGRILIGTEGINGAVSGKEEVIEEFKTILLNHYRGLTFREQHVNKNSYHKLVVRIRKEICVFGKEVNLKNTGHHLPAKELERWYEKGKRFTIVDARNDYEFEAGHFKNAVKLPIKNFREFADVAPAVLKDKKEETIVLYCTGGVRCEKASAYLNKQGFSDVHQVDGGIISYLHNFSSNWEGGLFVFDDRLVDEGTSPLNKCSFCKKKKTDHYSNCHNLDCDRLFIACSACLEKMNRTCSEACQAAPRQRSLEKEEQQKEMIGKVINYYPKAHVACIQLHPELQDKTLSRKELSFKGKTTHFSQVIEEVRIDDEGMVTFPVKEKVRKN